MSGLRGWSEDTGVFPVRFIWGASGYWTWWLRGTERNAILAEENAPVLFSSPSLLISNMPDLFHPISIDDVLRNSDTFDLDRAIKWLMSPFDEPSAKAAGEVLACIEFVDDWAHTARAYSVSESLGAIADILDEAVLFGDLSLEQAFRQLLLRDAAATTRRAIEWLLGAAAIV